MLKLAYFSDFHLRSGDLAAFDCAVALVEDAAERGANHLVITGDIVEAAEVDIVLEYFGELEERNYSLSHNVTFVPGNHDVFPWSKHWLTNPSFRSPTANWERLYQHTVRRRANFPCVPLLRGKPYPFGRVLTPDVVLVGLDTTRNGSYDPRRHAEGELPEWQMEAAARFLAKHSKVRHRVVLMHHSPFDENFGEWGKTVNQNFADPPAAVVRRWLRSSGATLVLCGHVHRVDGIRKARFNNGCQVLRAGISGGQHEDQTECDRQRGYHLIELKERGMVSIRRRLRTGADLISF